MVPKKIKTNALRNLVDTAFIFLLNLYIFSFRRPTSSMQAMRHLALKNEAVQDMPNIHSAL